MVCCNILPVVNEFFFFFQQMGLKIMKSGDRNRIFTKTEKETPAVLLTVFLTKIKIIIIIIVKE